MMMGWFSSPPITNLCFEQAHREETPLGRH